ncbi:hypothetical protein LguiA_027953 [Lonicera macranthoides]
MQILLPSTAEVKFKNEGAPTQEELNKLTDQEFECRKFTEISKRDARNAEWFGLEHDADHLARILANLRCDDLKKKKKKERGRWWWWWWYWFVRWKGIKSIIVCLV